jgi:hypothetical protein
MIRQDDRRAGSLRINDHAKGVGSIDYLEIDSLAE